MSRNLASAAMLQGGAVDVVEEKRYVGIDADEAREFDRDAEIYAGGKRGSPAISRRKCMPSEWKDTIATIRVAPSAAATRRVTRIDGSAMSRARRVYIADEISASLLTAVAFKCVACGWKMTIAAVGRSGDSLRPFAQRDNDRVFGIEQILDHGALNKIRIGPVTPPGALSACRVEADFG